MLRRFRRNCGLSQEALAQRAGLSSEAVSLLERNLRTPRPTTLTLLADALVLGAEDRDLFFAVSSSRVPHTHAVPQYLDRFFGRQAELSELTQQLRPGGARLVTLTGPGGVGKSRLAAVATSTLADPAAARWLRLTSGMTEPDFVAGLGAALAVPAPARISLAAIVDAVSATPMMLVLDQADALLSVVASACDTLLKRTRLHVIVTSRQRLQLGAEVVIPLATLSVPEIPAPDERLTVTSEAMDLFTDRSGIVGRPGSSTPTPSDLETAAVARIVRAVDGLPLAIELAAAMTRVLAVSELGEALEGSLELLSPLADGATLSGHLVGEDYRALSLGEQRLLGRLAVFSGSFDYAAVVALHDPDAGQGELLSLLASLVCRSLVLRQDDAAGNATFSLLRMVRDFATIRLDEMPESHEIRRRHATYFRDRAHRTGARLSDPVSSDVVARLEAEAANLRTAFAWCIDHDPQSSLQMVASLWPWWHASGLYREGRCSIGTALRSNPLAPARLKAPAFAAAGMLALLQSDYDEAQWHIQQALDAYSAADDGAGVGWTLGLLGALGRERGEYTVADQLHSQSLLLARRADDTHAIGAQLNALSQVSWLRGDLTAAEDRGQRALESLSAVGDHEGITWAFINLGVTARLRGDWVGAAVFLRHGLELSEAINYREGIAWSLNQLGVLDRLQGDTAAARTRQTQSLAEHRRLGNRWRMASVHDELAALAAVDRDGPQAITQLGAADQLRREISVPLPSAERSAHDETIAATQALMGSRFHASTVSEMARGANHSSVHWLTVGAC